MSDRFIEIMIQQLERTFLIGAVASDLEIELVSVDREWHFMHTGRLSLNLTDKNCPGLDLLVRIVTSSYDHNGYLKLGARFAPRHRICTTYIYQQYCPPDISVQINFQFKTLIRKRRSDRRSFVAFGTTNNQNAVIKVSNMDKCWYIYVVHIRCLGQT